MNISLEFFHMEEGSNLLLLYILFYIRHHFARYRVAALCNKEIKIGIINATLSKSNFYVMICYKKIGVITLDAHFVII